MMDLVPDVKTCLNDEGKEAHGFTDDLGFASFYMERGEKLAWCQPSLQSVWDVLSHYSGTWEIA